MATNDRPTIDLNSLVRGFVQDLRVISTPAEERGEEEANQGVAQLRQVGEHVRGQQAQASLEVNTTYRGRADAMQAVLADRLHRLEAYAERQRQAVPSSPDLFIVAGRVTDRATGAGLPHVSVRATDLDRREHDVLGNVRTDALGYFRIEYDAAQIDEADQVPETYIEVLDQEGNVVFTSTRSFVQKTGTAAFIAAEVEGSRLPENTRMAQKVAATVEHRHEDFAKRQRVLGHRPEIALNLGQQRSVPAAAPSPARVGESPAGGGAERPLTQVKGIGPAFRDRLSERGIEDVAKLARTRPSQVAEILNVSEERAKAMVSDAKSRARGTR